ncbi:MAG: hypothetical protein HY020_06770 [Burkholderiales bacterium]|nr:hypothetical protein [Burkholderiales bacterium]
MLTRLTLVTALAASLGLVACGGGSDDPLPPPPMPVATAVPDTAAASPMALVSYLNGQAFTDETSEPLTLPAAELATSETDEPLTI